MMRRMGVGRVHSMAGAMSGGYIVVEVIIGRAARGVVRARQIFKIVLPLKLAELQCNR